MISNAERETYFFPNAVGSFVLLLGCFERLRHAPNLKLLTELAGRASTYVREIAIE